MVMPSSSTPAELLAKSRQELLDEFVKLRQEFSSSKASLEAAMTKAADAMGKRQQADKSDLLAEVAKQGAAINDVGMRQQVDRNDILAGIAKQGGAINDLGTRQQGDKNDILAEVAKQGAAIHDLTTQQNADKGVILAKIDEQHESKTFKILLVALPAALTVLLGFVVWGLQISTTKQIDTSGKKLATGLALRAEYYKKKLGVYEDADKQMATLVSVMEDLRLDPKDSAKLKLAADTQAKLSEMSKVNGLYVSKEVSDGLKGVAFTAATTPLTGTMPAPSLQTLTDQVSAAEQLMKKELEGDFANFGAL